MKIKVLLFVFVLTSVISLYSCGQAPATELHEAADTPLPINTPVPTGTSVATVIPSATKTFGPTETPTRIPVINGHFIGTNPIVSFDEILWEITNFKITVPFKNNTTCTLSHPYFMDIDSKGTFSYSVYVWGNSKEPDIIVTGKLNDNSISGTYSIDICYGNEYSDKTISPYTGTWNAILNGSD
ncbi:MAG: hypothetical protein ABSC49_02840 [Candidatus Microgenomates bacterium]|jgi:hypothetical protein